MISLISDLRLGPSLLVCLSLSRPCVSLQGPRGIQGPPGQPGKPGKRVSELSDLLCSNWAVCALTLFVVVWLFVRVAAHWEAYLQSNKQWLDMCLNACTASNTRINAQAVNPSENAKLGKKVGVPLCTTKWLDLIDW